MFVEVVMPDEYHGTVIGQLNKRGGIITGTEGAESWTTIYAEVPLNNMFGYAGELRLVMYLEYIYLRSLYDMHPTQNYCQNLIELHNLIPSSITLWD